MKLIKFALAVPFLLMFSSAAFSQEKLYIGVQGKITDTSGKPVTETMNMRFRIYDSKTGSNVLWEESVPSVLVENGIFNVYLGEKTLFSPDIFKNNSMLFLGMKIGTEVELERQKMASFPSVFYASGTAHANSTDTLVSPADDLKCTNCIGKDELASNVALNDSKQIFTEKETFIKPVKFTVSGTYPFSVESSVKVENLNADFLDGYHLSEAMHNHDELYAKTDHKHDISEIVTGKFPKERFSENVSFLGNTIEKNEISENSLFLKNIGQNKCEKNQVIKWNGTKSIYECGDDLTVSGITLSAGTGIMINDTVVSCDKSMIQAWEKDSGFGSKTEITPLLQYVYSPVIHNHDSDYYTKTEFDPKLSSRADTGHNHDDLFYGRTEVDSLMSQKADKNHNHNDLYFSKTELNVAGTINNASNPVDWTELKGVPAFPASGIDNDTKYDAGDGLVLNSGNFSIDKKKTDAWYLVRDTGDSVTSQMIKDQDILFSDFNADNCAEGKMIKRNTDNSSWECAEDLYFTSEQAVKSVSASSPVSGSGGSLPVISLNIPLSVPNGGTGSSAQNFIDLGSTQTVAGNKTFSGNISFINSTINANITGNAGNVLNGAQTNVYYDDPSWIKSIEGSKISGNISSNSWSIKGILDISHGGTGSDETGSSGNILRSAGSAWESWTPDFLSKENDGATGNEISDASDESLIRTGSGTESDPYQLELNTSYPDIWTAEQQFNTGAKFAGSGIWNASGKIGIGTTDPEFSLSIYNDGGIAAKGNIDQGSDLKTSGAGTRLAWYPKKASFRAGYVDSTQSTVWDDSNTGKYSFGSGNSTKSSGDSSTAMGKSTSASGESSTALTYLTSASGSYSFAMGTNSASAGTGAVAAGSYLTAGSDNSIVIGRGVDNSNRLTNAGPDTLAVGFNSTVPTLYVTSEGNVGMGTTSPSAKLELTGTGQKIKATAFQGDASKLVYFKTISSAHTVDNIHASATKTAGFLLPLDSAGKLNADSTGTAKLVQNGVYDNAAYNNPSWISALNTSIILTGLIPSTSLKIGAGQGIDGDLLRGTHATGLVKGTGIQNRSARWNTLSIAATGVLYDDGTKTGINTVTPEFKLTVIGSDTGTADGSIMAKGTHGSGGTLATAGAGTRLIWYPKKSAFRAGYVNSTQWDDSNTGNYSTALGNSPIASGTKSAAFGTSSTATGTDAFAVGASTGSTGTSSVAIGNTASASADYSVSLGYSTTASGSYAFCTGANSTASGSNSFSMGQYLTSGSTNSIAMGKGVDSAKNLANNIQNSFIAGFNSTIPTLFIGTAYGSNTSGNVGISTANPSSRLDVNGNGNFTGQVKVSGKIVQINPVAQYPRGNSVVPVNSGGQDSTITIGIDGLPILGTEGCIISNIYCPCGFYHYVRQRTFRINKCSDTSCSDKKNTDIISFYDIDCNSHLGSDPGCSGLSPVYYPSISIGTDGLPVISFRENGGADLKVLKCSDPACSSSQQFFIDSAGNIGTYTSIAIGTDGLPIISYRDEDNQDLKVAKCVNSSCSGTSIISRVDSDGNVGIATSIAIGSDGLPVIAYHDETKGALKIAKCKENACSSPADITIVDSAGHVGLYPSLAIGTDGLPIISYYNETNQDLKIAKCLNQKCSSFNPPKTIDSTGNTGAYTSITIAGDGLPVISYRGDSNYLKIAKCGDLSCSAGNVLTTLSGSTDLYTSITTGTDGMPIIASYNGNLMVTHCANPFCISSWSRK